MEKVLHSLDHTWEEKKTRVRELAEKKGRRHLEVEEEAKPPRRMKKINSRLF